MKAIKIDVVNKTVTTVDVGPTLEELYEALQCEVITTVFFPEFFKDDMFVDDEALLKEPNEILGAFFTDLYPNQPIFSNGLVVGFDPETGERVDCKMTAEQVASTVRFLDEKETQEMFKIWSNIPPTIHIF